MEPMNHNEGVRPTKMPLRKKKKFVLGHKVTKVAQQKLVAWKPEDEYQVKANFKSKGLKHLSQMLLESHRFGKPPHIVKVFKETHTRKKDNTWVDKRSEQKPITSSFSSRDKVATWNNFLSRVFLFHIKLAKLCTSLFSLTPLSPK
ncbi:hypothetical protein JHK86_006538 [Glycine max]|nr:hypothetical protein JHK86_006538 [Glycine max]